MESLIGVRLSSPFLEFFPTAGEQRKKRLQWSVAAALAGEALVAASHLFMNSLQMLANRSPDATRVTLKTAESAASLPKPS